MGLGQRAPVWHAGGQEFESLWLHLDLRHRLTTVSLISESDFRIESDWLMRINHSICAEELMLAVARSCM